MRSIINKRISRHVEKYKLMEKIQHSLENVAHKSVVRGFFVRVIVHADEADPVDAVYLDSSKLLVKSLPQINQVVIRVRVVLWVSN